MQEPLVSICCITYNHAPYIKQCIEGFLMQQTTFPIEILIHDDCSTDGTTEIIRDYEKKYPDLIFPLYEEENQYQKGKASEIDFYNYKRARGKYIAYCEGDDYWTDPLKLQKQVDFMEANPDYSVCFHEIAIYNAMNKLFAPSPTYSKDGDFDITVDHFLNGREKVAQPLSMVFRLGVYDYEWQEHYTRYCDTMEIFHLLRVGKGRFMRFVGGQYNLQEGGVSATNPDMRRSMESCEDFQEMWEYTHEKALIKSRLDNFIWRLDICLRENNIKAYWTTVLWALKNNFSLGLVVLRKAIKKIIIKRLK